MNRSEYEIVALSTIKYDTRLNIISIPVDTAINV